MQEEEQNQEKRQEPKEVEEWSRKGHHMIELSEGVMGKGHSPSSGEGLVKSGL